MPDPVTEEYLQLVYTGGTNNSDPLLSLGGAFGQPIPYWDPVQHTLAQMLENIFPNVLPSEQAVGKTRYRCIGVKNTHPNGTMYYLRFKFVKTVGDCLFYFGWAPQAPGEAPQQLPNETTEPDGVTWYGANTAVEMPEHHLGPGETKALWFKLVIPAGASAQVYEYPECKFEWGAVGA